MPKDQEEEAKDLNEGESDGKGCEEVGQKADEKIRGNLSQVEKDKTAERKSPRKKVVVNYNEDEVSPPECIGHEFNLAEGENTSSTIMKHP